MSTDKIFVPEEMNGRKTTNNALVNAIAECMVDELQDSKNKRKQMTEANNMSEFPKIIEISSMDDLKDGKIAEEIRKIITGDNNTSERLRFKNNEDRREFIGKMNNQLKNYTKIAKNFLRMQSPREKADSLRGLLQLIEDECKSFINEDSLVEWDYIAKDSQTGVSREMTGAPDFEIYTSAFNNKEKRREFATILDCSPFKEQGMTFAELEIFVLHTAVKVELERAEKEFKCQSQLNSRHNNVHFSKWVSDEELTAIYNGLMEQEMLCNNPTLTDFIYWHTGQGTIPSEPLMWKTKNVCRYYVFRYLDSDWPTAEQCFSCKRGCISHLMSASNITKDNREIINEILKNSRQKSTKNTTKTD